MQLDEARALLAQARTDRVGAKANADAMLANYHAVLKEKKCLMELHANALPEEKNVYQTKLDMLPAREEEKEDELNTAKYTSRMYNHRVVELEQLIDDMTK